MKYILTAAKPKFFLATVLPLGIGTAAGWYDSTSFQWSTFLLGLVGIILLHTGTNLANEYYDNKSGADQAVRDPTPDSGGTRVLVDGFISPPKILYASLLAFALGSIVGIYLNHLIEGNTVLILGIIGVFFAFFYSAPPLKLGYRGLGEADVAITHGPILVLGGYFLQTQRLTWPVLWVSIPVGLLYVLLLLINQLPVMEAYKTVNRITAAVVLGRKRCVRLFIALLSLAYILVILGVILKLLPPLALIVLITVPIGFIMSKVVILNYDKIRSLLPAKKMCIGLNVLFDLLLVGGYVLSRVVSR